MPAAQININQHQYQYQSCPTTESSGNSFDLQNPRSSGYPRCHSGYAEGEVPQHTTGAHGQWVGWPKMEEIGREREDLEVERSFSCFFTPRNWDGKYGRLRTTGDDILFQTSIHDELRICWSRPPPVETELSFRGTDPAWRMQRSSAPMLSWRWVSSLGTAATLWPWGCYSRRLFPGISQGNIMGRTLARKNTTNETSLIHDKIDV